MLRAGPRPGPAPGDRPGRIRSHRVSGATVTGLACVLLLLALLAPPQPARWAPGAFVRIPVEGLVCVALAVALPARAARVLAMVAGAVLGLLTVLKMLDLGVESTLARPFDPVLDAGLLGEATDYVTAAAGRAAAIGAVAGAVLLGLGAVAATTWSVRRVLRIAAGHRRPAAASLAGLGLAWTACLALGVQLAPGEPVAARSVATLAYDHARQLQADLRDRAEFGRELGSDPARSIPADRLLTGLRGKDVILAVVESYGRSAVEDPGLAPGTDGVLDAGTAALRANGFGARSAWLTSATSGGGSWLAHSTLLSGLWVDNQQRDRQLLGSQHSTLIGDFGRAGWRTVVVMPGTTGPWPEGRFFGYDRLYAEHDLGYRGPSFGWATMPDQYTLSALQRDEIAAAPRPPVMAEVVLVSSHAPWAPLPRMVGWNDVGDGSVFDPMPAAARQPGDVWPDAARVRAAYGDSIRYSLTSVISYLSSYGTRNTVLVLVGDHQPAPVVTGEDGSRDVPVTIVAADPAVLHRVAGWGWQDGLRPAAGSPVWRMDAFRDRFLAAFDG